MAKMIWQKSATFDGRHTLRTISGRRVAEIDRIQDRGASKPSWMMTLYTERLQGTYEGLASSLREGEAVPRTRGREEVRT